MALLAWSAARTSAAPVSPDVAERAAVRWLAGNAVMRAQVVLPTVASVTPLNLGADAVRLYHVALAPRGYVILGGDDRVPPVIAFSASSDLNLRQDGQNALRALLGRDAVAAARALTADARESGRRMAAAHQSEWRVLTETETQVRALEGAEGPAAMSTVLVAPMITTQWGQWRHFNRQFPVDPAPGTGYDGRAPAGCMAVAGAQLAHFYAWPPYGRNGHVNTDANAANLISGVFATHFTEPIAWDAMQTQYDPWGTEPEAAVSAVSRLIYNIGIGLNLDFGSFNAGGSSASVQSLSRAMNRAYFFERGSPLNRSWNPTTFDGILRAEMLAGRPTVCSIPEHAVIVDGLSTDSGVDYFHMNYGLGGMNDGWYRTTATPDGGLETAIFYQRPALIPLLAEAGVVTNTSGHVRLEWDVSPQRLWEVTRYRVREGQWVATNFVDAAFNLNAWTDYASAWFVDSPGHQGGSALRKTGEIGEFELVLRNVFIPAAATRLQFHYKAILVNDRVDVEVSTDRGQTWTSLCHFTGTGYDDTWRWQSLNLGAYAGRELTLRFVYRFPGGQHYGANGGFWLDNVSIDTIQWMQWTVLDDQVPADAAGYTVGPRLGGTQHFEVQAHDGTAWSKAAPFVSVTIDLDPDLDADLDGLPNGWEALHFGSPIGADADLDSDGDGMSNRAEFLAGTDPHDAFSRLALTTPPAATAPGVAWLSVADKTYTVWRASAVDARYVPVATNLPATPPVNTFTDPAAATLTTAFYRISVE